MEGVRHRKRRTTDGTEARHAGRLLCDTLSAQREKNNIINAKNSYDYGYKNFDNFLSGAAVGGQPRRVTQQIDDRVSL